MRTEQAIIYCQYSPNSNWISLSAKSGVCRGVCVHASRYQLKINFISNGICLTRLLYYHCISFIWWCAKLKRSLKRWHPIAIAFVFVHRRRRAFNPVKVFHLTSSSSIPKHRARFWYFQQIKCEIPSVKFNRDSADPKPKTLFVRSTDEQCMCVCSFFLLLVWFFFLVQIKGIV